MRRLPEKYRVLVLLCYFEGLTHEQAALRLGCPIGTVKGRLARARDLLRKRLVRRGVTISTAAIAAHLDGPDVCAAVPESLRCATLQAARAVAAAAGASIVTATSVSIPVATLTEGVLQAMILSKLKAIGITLLVIGAVTTGVAISAAQGTAYKPPDRTALRAALAEDAAIRQAAERKTHHRAGSAGSSKPATEGEGLASPAPAAGGGQAQAVAGVPAAESQPPKPETGRSIEGGADDDGSAEEFQNRLTIAQLAAALAASEQKPENEALLKALDEPLTMSFPKPTPLAGMLKYIKDFTSKPGATRLPIYVDPKGLEDADVTLESKFVIDLEGVPLKTSLRLALKQLGLAFCVRDGVIIISSLRASARSCRRPPASCSAAGMSRSTSPCCTRWESSTDGWAVPREA